MVDEKHDTIDTDALLRMMFEQMAKKRPDGTFPLSDMANAIHAFPQAKGGVDRCTGGAFIPHADLLSTLIGNRVNWVRAAPRLDAPERGPDTRPASRARGGVDARPLSICNSVLISATSHDRQLRACDGTGPDWF